MSPIASDKDLPIYKTTMNETVPDTVFSPGDLFGDAVHPSSVGTFLQGCSKRLYDKAAGSGATEAYPSHPPNPELSEQLFSRVGYVEDGCETRTTLRAFFSSRLSSCPSAGMCR